MKLTKNKIIIGFTACILLGIFVFTLVRAFYYAPTDEIVLSPSMEEKFTTIKNIEVKKVEASQYKPSTLFVSRLTIPSLKINAKIQNVGINKKGNMSTPNNFSDVGLYKYGPTPGEKGSAVIAGHVDNRLGLKAVFGNLKNIKKGDDIYVEIEKGKKVHFIVKSTDTYDFNAKADPVFNQDDGEYLKLITCTGNWIPQLKTHDKRLVVTAIKV